jgi:hypothetical protein
MNDMIECACGCGTLIPAINKSGKPARYVRGHNSRDPQSASRATQFKKGDRSYWEGKPNPHASAVHKGKKLSDDEIARRTATRRAKYDDGYGAARGYKWSDESRARLSAVQKAQYASGERVAPHKGATFSKETRERISRAKSGPLNHGWKGGIGYLPYGPEFNRKYKRLIRERDGYKCVRCGMTQEEHKAKHRVGLHVHHLDHDKFNNDPSNLVTSCAACNVWASKHKDEPFLPSP